MHFELKMSKTISKTANRSFRQPGLYASGEDSKRRVPASNSVKCGLKEKLSRIDTLEESIFKGEMVTLNVHFIITLATIIDASFSSIGET